METECGTKLTRDDALAYLQAIKDVFSDEKGNYHSFLYLMKDYKDKRIDIERVVERVKEMFKGHTDLLLGFNIFLPNKYEIILPIEGKNLPKQDDQTLRTMHDEHKETIDSLKRIKEDEQPPNKMLAEATEFVDQIKDNEQAPKRMRVRDMRAADFVNKTKEDEQSPNKMHGEAIGFVEEIKEDEHLPKEFHAEHEEAAHIVENTEVENQPPNKMNGRHEEVVEFLQKIKTRFQDNNNVYKSFIDIMNMLGEGKKSITEAFHEVVVIFEGHADLLHEFTHFLPGASRGATT